jgi:hypothetical protein
MTPCTSFRPYARLDVRYLGLPDSFAAGIAAAMPFLEARRDFVDETANGTEDIWWIDEGKDYPKLWWETNGN